MYTNIFNNYDQYLSISAVTEDHLVETISAEETYKLARKINLIEQQLQLNLLTLITLLMLLSSC